MDDVKLFLVGYVKYMLYLHQSSFAFPLLTRKSIQNFFKNFRLKNYQSIYRFQWQETPHIKDKALRFNY